jgi:hypothetical protein
MNVALSGMPVTVRAPTTSIMARRHDRNVRVCAPQRAA